MMRMLRLRRRHAAVPGCSLKTESDCPMHQSPALRLSEDVPRWLTCADVQGHVHCLEVGRESWGCGLRRRGQTPPGEAFVGLRNPRAESAMLLTRHRNLRS